MKINNRRVKTAFYLYYLFLLLIVSLFYSVFTVVERMDNFRYEQRFLAGLVVSSIFFSLLRGKQLFEYDSEGEVLIFRQGWVMLSALFPNSRKLIEFPKRKLYDFRIVSLGIRKTLELTLKSSGKGKKRIKINITYLNSKEVYKLKQSLERARFRQKQSIY